MSLVITFFLGCLGYLFAASCYSFSLSLSRLRDSHELSSEISFIPSMNSSDWSWNLAFFSLILGDCLCCEELKLNFLWRLDPFGEDTRMFDELFFTALKSFNFSKICLSRSLISLTTVWVTLLVVNGAEIESSKPASLSYAWSLALERSSAEQAIMIGLISLSN